MPENIRDVSTDVKFTAAAEAIVQMAATLNEIRQELTSLRTQIGQIQAAQTNLAAAAQRR